MKFQIAGHHKQHHDINATQYADFVETFVYVHFHGLKWFVASDYSKSHKGENHQGFDLQRRVVCHKDEDDHGYESSVKEEDVEQGRVNGLAMERLQEVFELFSSTFVPELILVFLDLDVIVDWKCNQQQTEKNQDGRAQNVSKSYKEKLKLCVMSIEPNMTKHD